MRRRTIATTTELLYRQHADERSEGYAEQQGTCCFCGRNESGVLAEEQINYQYFTDFHCMDRDTGHICMYCAFCMDGNVPRRGSWFVNDTVFEKVSTGDLLQRFHDIAAGEYGTPFAFRTTPSPIKAQHAYLWTPVAADTQTFPVSFGKQQVTVAWPTFKQVVAVVEELRRHRFRLDDIRRDAPRVNALDDIGPDRYQDLSRFLAPYRGSALFELAITASRGEDDQDDLINTTVV